MRGRPKGGAGDAAPEPFGIGAGTPGPVGAVAVKRIRSSRTAAQAAWSRHASRASRDRTALHPLRPSADVFGQLPLAVGRRWTPRHGKRGRRLKGQPTGGHAEQAD